MSELQRLMDSIGEWSDSQFGNHRTPISPAYHLKEEVDELISSLNKTYELGADDSIGVGEFGRQLQETKMEFADCFMLILDSARIFGLDAKRLINITHKKLNINKTRSWGKPDKNGVVKHL